MLRGLGRGFAVWVGCGAVSAACDGGQVVAPNAEASSMDAAGGVAVTCGPGTALLARQCVVEDGGDAPPADAATNDPPVDASVNPADASAVVCGPGTWLSGTVCLPDGGAPFESGAVADSGAPLVCGAGTYQDGGACVALPAGNPPCGAGTFLQGGVCVANDAAAWAYELRVPATVNADGYSLAPVLALGPTGADVAQGVVLGLSPSLGSLVNTQLLLGAVGATTYYRPCSTANAGCAGSVQVTMALASAPGQIVATSNPMALVAPAGVGDPSPCLTGGDVLFFNGDAQDYIHPGIETITGTGFQATYSTYGVSLNVSTSAQSTGTTWMLDMSTQQLNLPIAAQVYTGAQRAPFAAAGHPGLEISGDGRGCNTIAGSFQIETLQVTGSTLHAFTATFEQHCEAGTSALRGCVHIEQ